MLKFAVAVLTIMLAAGSILGQNQSAPTLRIVTEDPNLPSELYYGNIKVKPLRLRPGTNQPITIDDADFFVYQQYLDFLNRFPDQGGWDYWTGEINKCGTDQVCINRRRLGVSAAFFVENEFQRTGGFIYRIYRSTLNRPPTYAEFMQDRKLVIEGDTLEATKVAYVNAFVQRTEFVQKYQTASSFVDAVIETVKATTEDAVNLTSQRSSLITLHNSGGRAAVVRQVAEDAAFAQAVKNNSFVRMEYFGYLRRDPDPPGEAFWNNILNNKEPNNYRGMVCAFLTSREYQERFGTVVTHHDSECGSATQ